MKIDSYIPNERKNIFYETHLIIRWLDEFFIITMIMMIIIMALTMMIYVDDNDYEYGDTVYDSMPRTRAIMIKMMLTMIVRIMKITNY